jgi:hypothetical protein
MTNVTSEEIRINNSIYESIIDGGTEILNNPAAMDDEDPLEFLDGSIQFFADLGTVDGDLKRRKLLKVKERYLDEQISVFASLDTVEGYLKCRKLLEIKNNI